jgi:hypothetical protein
MYFMYGGGVGRVGDDDRYDDDDVHDYHHDDHYHYETRAYVVALSLTVDDE